MSKAEKLLAFVVIPILSILLIAVSSYGSWLFYFAPCQTIKQSPIPIYTPSRCIK